MNKEKLRDIFIEEANEIIEKLDIDIVNFEHEPSNKEILNSLFRGVHTLKGSANSFGFSRLGGFVHSFEDLLGFYRENNDAISSSVIDIFLEAVDIIKEVLDLELSQNNGIPANYNECLDSIKSLLNSDIEKEVPKPEIKTKEKDLASEFSEFDFVKEKKEIKNKKLIKEDENINFLYKIILNFDSDVYTRGYDHSTFFTMLSSHGKILNSYWDMSKVPPLNEFNLDNCFIGTVEIFMVSTFTVDAIEEVFSFLDDDEYSIEQIKDLKDTYEEKLQEPIKEKTKVITEEITEIPIQEKITSTQIEATKVAEKQKIALKEIEKSFIKIDTKKLDELFDSIGELVIAQNFLLENENIKNLNDEGVSKTVENLSKITRLIQNRVMNLRMVPIKATFEKMKRVLRDTSKKVNKEVELTIVGEDTEIDKTMTDKLSDPLIHLIRNSVDHGIESSFQDRVNANKTKEGNVYLKAYHKGGNIIIEVSDDGAGIDKDRVLKKAIERGLVQKNQELSESQIFSLLLEAGFSTAEQISDVSGRGVGLDVVRNSIENLRGKIEIESKKGVGTAFKIVLPLTLAIIDGMIVKSSNESFIIPTLSIIESFKPTEEMVYTAQEKGEFVNLRDEIIPIARLNNLLELSNDRPKASDSILVCVESENEKYAILVDELLGRQQVVIKTLGKLLLGIKEIAGGAIMGNGEVALILNIDGIFNQK